MNYQVMLTDDADQPLVDQAVELVFTLWTQESGGTQEWTETHNTMTNSIGVVSVILGSMTPLDPADFSAPLWLEVEVDGEIMAPRRELASAPYALHAADSDQLGGAAPGAYSLDGHDHDADYVNEGQGNSVTTGMLVPDIVSSLDGVSNDGGNIDLVEGAGVTITPNDGANTITIAATGGSDDGDWTIAGGDVYRTTGDVGIGTASPDAKLEVVATAGEAGWFSTSDSGTYDAALVAENTLGTGATFAALDPPSMWPANPAAISAFGGSGARAAYFYSDGHDDGVRIDGLGTGSALDARAHGNGYAGRFEGGWGVYVEADASRAADFRTDYPIGDWNTHVIHAEYTYSGDNHGVAVQGESVPADGYGSGGVFVGGYSGVQGGVLPTGTGEDHYYGVLGSANHVTTGDGSTHGVHGIGRDNTHNFGVSGEGRHGLYSRGVSGEAYDANYNFGVKGHGEGGFYAYGVYGTASSGSTVTAAGWFQGDVRVTGTLTKGGGTFKIDHPLDPQNKYLCHSFVESPDMMNVYNGNVVLDAAGEAWIEMPEWFEVLNRDFRYQLTPIGGAAPDLHIAEKMVGGRFMIAGGEPGMEVSWQVTGIRQDRFAEANRVQVEIDKRPDEAGKYIHPELYGRSREEGIGYVPSPPADPKLR
jgi:hypothetical protein